ncbi:uncharacterized protein KGF55_000179 [Candida pseudojiufengensis]|uniref:uncharacterized protein n=1 Tax=Candida pseudojiufengensis TaxID=497109 RepID=UPI0022256895|nr:uncharacterized protein KGF55_000179 [Candida pseudojiufengensis]KAI5966770.1 hypothetical protein KGF55_000179 [Candida pseudojiufengensis]
MKLNRIIKKLRPNSDKHSINQPIEHSNPRSNQNHDKPPIIEKSCTNFKRLEKRLNIENIGRFKLNELPNEIILNITKNLSQFEVLKLIRTCSKLYELILPQLYQHIIIDTSLVKFNNQEYETNGRTYINSVTKLKRFIKTYVEKSDNDSSNIKIYKFECLKIPNTISIYDKEFVGDIIQLFQKLNNLTTLIWLNPVFKFLTKLAPFLSSLTHLCLGIQQIFDLMPQFLKELAEKNTTLTVLDLAAQFHPDLSFLISKFQNLKKLSLEIYDPINYKLCQNLNIEFFKKFKSLNLESLRVNNTTDKKSLMYLISSQKSLKYLDIIGIYDNGSRSFKSDMICGKKEKDKFNIQQIALSYFQINLNLKYININNRLFLCDELISNVKPIDKLHYWFESKVRCLNYLDNFTGKKFNEY